MDKSIANQANKDLIEQERSRVVKYMAEFNGKITAAWHKMCKDLDKNLGDSDEDNVFFLCFHAGACEGSLINNKVWLEHLRINNDK